MFGMLIVFLHRNVLYYCNCMGKYFMKFVLLHRYMIGVIIKIGQTFDKKKRDSFETITFRSLTISDNSGTNVSINVIIYCYFHDCIVIFL